MKFDGNCLLPSNLENIKRAQFFIAGAEKEINYFLDDIKLDYFVRNRDWRHAADLRIDDLRTIDLKLDSSDLEGQGIQSTVRRMFVLFAHL